jgi:hypothetical protein
MAGVFYTPAALLEALKPRSYDPSCGTGGMLSRDPWLDELRNPPLRPPLSESRPNHNRP